MSCGLRDVVEFEQEGRPAVLIASSAFSQTATDQAERLGAPGLQRVFVPHPVQDRTDQELRAMAGAVVEGALAAISAA